MSTHYIETFYTLFEDEDKAKEYSEYIMDIMHLDIEDGIYKDEERSEELYRNWEIKKSLIFKVGWTWHEFRAPKIIPHNGNYVVYFSYLLGEALPNIEWDGMKRSIVEIVSGDHVTIYKLIDDEKIQLATFDMIEEGYGVDIMDFI